MKIALVAEEAAALAHPVGSEPATQETRVAVLAETLASQNHDVTIYARKDAADLPDEDKLPGGVRVEYITAGPAEVLVDEALRRTNGNQAAAARLLGVTRQAMNVRVKRNKGSN